LPEFIQHHTIFIGHYLHCERPVRAIIEHLRRWHHESCLALKGGNRVHQLIGEAIAIEVYGRAGYFGCGEVTDFYNLCISFCVVGRTPIDDGPPAHELKRGRADIDIWPVLVSSAEVTVIVPKITHPLCSQNKGITGEFGIWPTQLVEREVLITLNRHREGWQHYIFDTRALKVDILNTVGLIARLISGPKKTAQL